MIKYLLILLLPLSMYGADCCTDVQAIPGRTITWNPGVQGGIPYYPNCVNVMDYGAVGNGIADDWIAFNDAKNACTNGGAIFVPAGTYKLTNNIFFTYPERKVLRSHPNAYYVLTKKDYDFAYFVFGGSAAFSDRLQVGITSAEGRQSNVVVSSSLGMNTGKYFMLRMTNSAAPDVIYGASQAGVNVGTTEYVGQMFRIEAIAGTTLTMSQQIYWTNYVPSAMRGYYFNGLTEYCGIEGGNFASNDQATNIVFMFGAANCWVTQTSMTNATETTIAGQSCYATTVRSNFLAYHKTYTAASRYAYGLGIMSTDNLLEDNILYGHNLAVSIVQGSVGNVVGYNYSEYGWGAGFPTDNAPKGFLNTHGDGAMYNLFEGNVAPVIEIDDFWGANSRTMIFRNWCRRQSFYDASGTNVSLQNIAGVEIDTTNRNMTVMFNNIGIPRDEGDPDLGIKICYSHRLEQNVPDPTVTNTVIIHGNFDRSNGTVTYSNQFSTVACASMYLTSKPNFFGIFPYPMIGPDVATYGITNFPGNPAMARALGSNYSTIDNLPRVLGAKFRNAIIK